MIKEFQGEYRFLSNFYPCQIEYEGIIYPSTEHAFQAAKTVDPQIRKYISEIEKPGQAKRYARTITLRRNWDLFRLSVMRQVLILKFTQPYFMDKLLATGDKRLVEGNTWGDIYWGVDLKTGKGQNNLGRILMEIREELRK